MTQLLAATSTQHHQFIADDISLLDGMLVRFRDLSGHRQLTDVYLLALAVTHNARLGDIRHPCPSRRRPRRQRKPLGRSLVPHCPR